MIHPEIIYKHCRAASLLLMIALMFSVSPVQAANPAMSATGILDKVVAKLSDSPSLEMQMSVSNGGETFNANVTIARDKFRYATGGMAVFYDGTTQWTVDSDMKEVTLTLPTADEVSETNPLAFVQNYRKKYNVSLVGESGGTYTVKMIALSKSAYIRTAQVVVSSTTWLPTHVTAQLSTGQTLTVRIVSSKTGKVLPLSDFRFDTKKNPGFEVIDMR